MMLVQVFVLFIFFLSMSLLLGLKYGMFATIVLFAVVCIFSIADRLIERKD